MCRDLEAGAAQHRLDAGAIGNPPVGPVVRVLVLDKMQDGVARALKLIRAPEVIVLLQRQMGGASPLHGLEDQDSAGHMLVDEIERKERMAQVVENAEEQNDVELFPQCANVVDRHAAEL